MAFTTDDFKQPRTVYEVWSFIKGLILFSPPILPKYTEATLPDPTTDKNTGRSNEAGLIYVSDGAAGTKVRYSDGDSWISLG